MSSSGAHPTSWSKCSLLRRSHCLRRPDVWRFVVLAEIEARAIAGDQ